MSKTTLAGHPLHPILIAASVSPDAPEVKPPGDERLEGIFGRLEERFAPEDGPEG